MRSRWRCGRGNRIHIRKGLTTVDVRVSGGELAKIVAGRLK